MDRQLSLGESTRFLAGCFCKFCSAPADIRMRTHSRFDRISAFVPPNDMRKTSFAPHGDECLSFQQSQRDSGTSLEDVRIVFTTQKKGGESRSPPRPEPSES